MTNPLQKLRVAQLISVAFQIAGLAFMLMFGQQISSALPVLAFWTFVVVYLFGIRAISIWLLSALRGAAA